MDRKEIDKETKATKNTKNILFWIVGIGIVLSIIAFMLYTPGSVKVGGGESTPGTVLSDTVAGDHISDTLATDVQR